MKQKPTAPGDGTDTSAPAPTRSGLAGVVDTLRQPAFWKTLFTTPMGLFWTLSYIAAAIFTWWVPNDVFERWPETRAFADFMASHVTQIERVTTLGGVKAGNANRFVYSVLWAVMPIYIFSLVMQGKLNYTRSYYSNRGQALLAFVLILAGGGQTYFFWVADPTAGVVRGTMSSWIGRGLWSPLFAFFPLCCVYAATLTLHGTITGGIVRKEHSK